MMLPHLHIGLAHHGFGILGIAFQNPVEHFSSTGILFQPGGKPADLILVVEIVGIELEETLVHLAGLAELLLGDQLTGCLLLVLRFEGGNDEYGCEEAVSEARHAIFPNSRFMRAISSIGLNGLMT